MISPSLIESSMLFFQLKLLIYCTFNEPYHVVLVVDAVFHRLVFICSLGSVIRKKHKNPYGKDSNYTNVIDTSTVGCTLLRNVSSFLFFMSAASLWPWATRPGCFSHVIAFFSSSIIFYLIQNPWGCSFLIYKHACLDFFNWPLTTTNSSSVNTLFSSCINLRSALSFGYQANIALACLLKFFGMAE